MPEKTKHQGVGPQYVKPPQNALGSEPPTLDLTPPKVQGVAQFGPGASAPTLNDLNVAPAPKPLEETAGAVLEWDIPDWQIRVQNKRGTKGQKVTQQEVFAKENRRKTFPEILAEMSLAKEQAAQAMDPQTARIDAAQHRLSDVLAQRPEIAEQMKLLKPNEAQLFAAGIAAMLNPGQAFNYLATPFAYQLHDQQERQDLANQQFASDQEDWRLRLQKATGELGNEYDLEQNRQNNAQKSYSDLLDYEQNIFNQEQLNQREQMRIDGRYTLQEMKGMQDYSRSLMQEMARMDREAFKSPEAVALRIQQALIAGGMEPQQAGQFAWAEVQSDYYRNLLTQAQTANTNARTQETLTMLPFKVQQGIMNIAKTQAEIEFIQARVPYYQALTEAVGENLAIRWAGLDLDLARLEQQGDKAELQEVYDRADAMITMASGRAKLLQEQIDALESELTGLDEDDDAARIAQIGAMLNGTAGQMGLREQLGNAANDYDRAQRLIDQASSNRSAAQAGRSAADIVSGGAAAGRGGFLSADVKKAADVVGGTCRAAAQCAEGVTKTLQKLGVNIPTILGAQRTAQWLLANGGVKVANDQMKPGDVLWVQGPNYGGKQSNGRRSGHHVEIYLGNGKVYNRTTSGWKLQSANRHGNAKVTVIRPPAA